MCLVSRPTRFPAVSRSPETNKPRTGKALCQNTTARWRALGFAILALMAGVWPHMVVAQTAQAGPVVSFPQTAVGTPSTPLPVTFTFGSSTSIAAPAVLTQGATGLDYTDAGTGSCTTSGSAVVYQAGQSCTVYVTFTAKVPGQRLGAVQLTTPSGAIVATAVLNGIGIGPYLLFGDRTPTTTITSIPSKNDVLLQGVATDGNGDVFLVDNVNGVIREVVASNGAVTPSSPVIKVGSGLTDPQGIAVDAAGDILVIDNNAVKEIVAVNGVLSTTSPVITLSGGYSQLVGVAVDGSGNVYFTDTGTATIYEMMAVNGAVTASSPVSPIFAGPNNNALFGLRVDSLGNIFVVTSNGGSAGGGAPTEIVATNGTVSPISSYLGVVNGSSTYDVAIDAADDAYTSPAVYGNFIYVYSGNPQGILNSVATIAATVPNLSSASGMAYDGNGHLYELLVAGTEVVLVGNNLRTASPLNFPLTAVGSTSYQSAIYLQNGGNAPLTFEAPTMGTNPAISAQFTLSTDPYLITGPNAPPIPSACTQLTLGSAVETVAPGGICYDFVTFHASPSAGTVTGTIVHTDNDQGSTSSTYATQTISLSASTGSSITIAVTPVSVPSGSTSATLNAAVTFSGPAPTGALTFTVDGSSVGTGTCTSSSSTSETCTLTYNPSSLAVGTHTLLATIAPDTNYLQTSSTVTNNLTVTQSAIATTTQTATVFPDTPFGSTSAPVTVTFTFQTAGTMAAPRVLTTGATGLDFTDAGTGTCTTNGTSHMYAPGGTCTVNVVFQPTALGYRSGSVLLNASGQNPTSVANLVGNGTGAWLLYTGNPIYIGTPPFTPLASFAEGAGSSDSGMVIDGKGDLYFTDANTSTVKMMAATNGVIAPGTPITTVLSGFVLPKALAIDGSGNLYVMDTGAGAIEEFMATNGVVSSNSTMVTLQDGLSGASGVGVDPNGNVFFMATTGNYIYALSELIAVNGAVAPNTTPTLIASDVVIDYYSGLAANIRIDGAGNVYLITNSGLIRFNATNGSVQPGASTYIYPESDVFGGAAFNDAVIMPSGDLFVANNPAFFHYNSGLGPYQESEVPLGELFTISAMATDGHGHIYAEVAAKDNPTSPPAGPSNTIAIEELDLTAPPTLTFAPTQVGSTSAVQSFVIQNEGNETLYLNDTSAGLIGTITPGFTPTTICYGGSVVTTPQSVYPAIGCNMSVAFSPVAGQSGTVNGTFTLTDNTLNATNATQTVPLVGTATSASAPTPTVTVATNYGAGVNQPATLLATVTSATTGTISGTVTFYDNGVAIPNGSAALFSGSVIVTVAALSVGTHPITAVFTPTGNTFAASTSPVSTLTVYPNTATIYPGNTFFLYDGTPHAVTATTVPAGLSYSVTYDGSPTVPSAVGSYRVIATITDPNYSGTASGTLTISNTPTSATITIGNLSATYTGQAQTVTFTTNPAGLSVRYAVGGLGNYSPSNAGYYPVTVEVITPGYTGSATGELIIAPAQATITLSNLTQPYSGSPIYPTITTVPASLVNDVSVTFNGSSFAPVQPGTYTVVATTSGNYAGTATGTLTITAGTPATVTLSNLYPNYTGSPLSPTVTTSPAGLAVALTYNGSPTTPTNGGTYYVLATVTSPGYNGSTTGYFSIVAVPASVTLTNLNQMYNGSPISAGATTSPPGLAVTFTYNNSSTPPTNPGSYTVLASIVGPNYYGDAQGTLTISSGAVAGAIFVAGPNGVGALNATGGVLSATAAGGGTGAAVDSSGNVWSIDTSGQSLAEFMPNGALSSDYGNLGLTGATALAIDGNNNLWVANGNGSFAVISTSGVIVSAATGSTSTGGSSFAIDTSGNVWVTNTGANSVDEIIGGAAPVAPLTIGVQNSTLGVKP